MSNEGNFEVGDTVRLTGENWRQFIGGDYWQKAVVRDE